MDIFTPKGQTNTMIRRTYLQAFGVCIIGAFFISSFLADGASVLARTYDTVRMRSLDTLHSAMIMDGTFASEDTMVCGDQLNLRLHDVLPGYTSDPTGLNIPGCDDGFAFIPFIDGGGGVLISVIEDRDNANFNHAYDFTVTSRKIAVSSICKNGNCDDVVGDDAEHTGYYAKLISL